MTEADPLVAFTRRLGHAFADPDLLTRALTHPSWANEHPPAGDNESLALLGDAALALVVAEHLLRVRPDAPVGALTQERAALVSGANLARWAAALDLGDRLRLGAASSATAAGRSNPSWRPRSRRCSVPSTSRAGSTRSAASWSVWRCGRL
jgi:ribonuclease-3